MFSLLNNLRQNFLVRMDDGPGGMDRQTWILKWYFRFESLTEKKKCIAFSCNNKILPLTIIQNQVMAQKFMEKKEISKHPS